MARWFSGFMMRWGVWHEPAAKPATGLNILSLNVAGLVPGFYVLHWLDARGRTGQRNFVRI